MDLQFTAEMVHWRGPSPYHFVPVPEEECADIRELSTVASYGWGVIPVSARIGESDFETSLFPKDGGYLLPVRDAIRKAEGLHEGDPVTVEMAVRMGEAM